MNLMPQNNSRRSENIDNDARVSDSFERDENADAQRNQANFYENKNQPRQFL